MKLYAYCLADGLVKLDVRQRGVSGAAVRQLTIDDFAVLVSDSDGVTPVTRENAFAHDAVVRSVLHQTTPLPFRFGSLVTEQQLRSYISTHASALKIKLAHVRGCLEMNLKIMWNVAEPAKIAPAAVSAEGAGTAFLKKKRRELLVAEQQGTQTAELSALLNEPLNGLLRDEKIALRPSKTVVLAAVAHLVETGKIPRYRERIAATRDSRPDLRFMISGPWPPYSFANIELEFKSHFGVS